MTLDTPSEYLTRPLRDEQTARAQIAEKGQQAFYKVAAMRTETEQLLWEAKSALHDLNQREWYSQAAFDERLMAECKYLCGGDELKAQLLASAVLE